MEKGKKHAAAGPKRGEFPPIPPRPQVKDPSSLFCPGIAFAMLLAASITLKCIVMFLILRASQVQVPSAAKTEQTLIQSCLQKCIPCSSAKDSVTANLTLDPTTNNPHLYISDDLKSVRWKGRKQDLSSGPLRFDLLDSVLTQESFTLEKICWEVEVLNGGTWWGVGVAKESANRNKRIYLAPGGGFWGIQHIDGQYQSITDPRTNLSLCHHPTRIRVSLDYSEGQIAFFDGDTNAELFSFQNIIFSGERLCAWLLIEGWNGELMLHP